jgi:hypothetical protein
MSAAKCEPGWGDGLSSETLPELRDHPTPPLRVDPPPPGEGKKSRALSITAFALNVVPAGTTME